MQERGLWVGGLRIRCPRPKKGGKRSNDIPAQSPHAMHVGKVESAVPFELWRTGRVLPVGGHCLELRLLPVVMSASSILSSTASLTRNMEFSGVL